MYVEYVCLRKFFVYFQKCEFFFAISISFQIKLCLTAVQKTKKKWFDIELAINS